MECEIKWVKGAGISFIAGTGSGHNIKIDTAKQNDIQSIGPRPMEIFLVGAVGCTMYDLVAGIQDSRALLHSCAAIATGIRKSTAPKIFTQITVKFVIVAENISRERIKKILDDSRDINGSAMRMLDKSAEIIFEFELASRP